jgi:hypothetical protein
MKYIVIQKTGYKNPYIVVDEDKNNEVVLDGNGYGYKTAQSAHIALNYILKGKAARNQNMNNFRKWKDENPEIFKAFNTIVEINMRELAHGEITIDDIFKELEENYTVSIAKTIRKLLLKS